MKREYFIYNNKQYNKGTVVILRRFDPYSRKVCNTKATFISYNTDTKEYIFEIYNSECKYTEGDFRNSICEIYNPNKRMINMNNSGHTFSDELSIDSLCIAWIWYVFIMAVGFIFYARIGIWILSSMIFFNYRTKKLKEAGYR